MTEILKFVAPQNLSEGDYVMVPAGFAVLTDVPAPEGGLAEGVADGTRAIDFEPGRPLPEPGGFVYLGEDRRPTGENTGQVLGRVVVLSGRTVIFALNGR